MGRPAGFIPHHRKDDPLDTNVRETKRADELKPGDWIAPRELLDEAAEVLHVLAYEKPVGTGTTVHLVVRKQGGVVPYTDSVPAGTPFELATEADLAELREQAERAQKIADIRALANYLEANPWMPMPYSLHGQTHGLTGDDVPMIRQLAERAGREVDDSRDDRTDFDLHFGCADLSVIAWHHEGRPVEPEPLAPHPTWPTEAELKPWESLASAGDRIAESMEPADPTGQLYSREADDPTPVSGARVEPHVGGMTEGGLVDETPAEPVTVYFSFGHGQTDPDTGEDLLDHYVTVIAPSYNAARLAMFSSRYGERWAFDYLAGTPQANEWIPRWTEHDAIDAMPEIGA